MKKVQRLLLAGSVALAGLCLAQDPQSYYAVIDLTGGPSAPNYPVSYTNAAPDGGWGAEYMTNKLVLQKFVESPTNHYYVSVSNVTYGQIAHVLGVLDPNSTLPYFSYVTDLPTYVGQFISAVSDRIGFPDTFASLADNAYEPFPSTPDGPFYVYLKTAYLLTVNGGTGGVYTNAGETVAVAATLPPGALFVEWRVEPTSAVANVADVTNANTFVTMPWHDLTLTAVVSPYLAVTNGTGSGFYTLGATATVAAAELAHQSFEKWQVEPPNATNSFGGLFVETDAITSLIVSNSVALTATYTNMLYTLTVANGTGSGAYTNGQVVAIGANPPPAAYEFDRWTGNTYTVADVTNPVTTVTIPGSAISLTATYVPKRYPLTVKAGTGSGNYTNGQVVAIAATLPPSTEHTFDYWTNIVGVTVADPSASPTTLTMQDGPASVTAVYKSIAVLQNTFMIVDLTGGSPEYRDTPPESGWTDDYKTDRMVFRKVPPGNFTMGSPANEAGHEANETQHAVTLTRDFYLGLFEVTQAQWQRLEDGNPSYFTGDDTRPVERVSYVDIRGSTAQANWPSVKAPASGSFMGRLRGKPGLGTADLPTEAQWEYACRAGTAGAHAGDVDSLAWYAENSGGTTRAVGMKAPNAWGFHDMHGNVSEICLNWYTVSPVTSPQTDPEGFPNGINLRVRRGGSYDDSSVDIRSARRVGIAVTNFVTMGSFITNATRTTGFRVAVPQTTASYRLTVANGAVNTGGVFAAGTPIGLTPAPAPDGQKFAVWQVAPTGLALGASFVATNAQTLLTMPAAAVTVTAIYIPTDATGIYSLLIENPGATNELWMADGADVTITASAPATGYRFAGWTVSPADADLGAGFVRTNATTTVVMPAMNVTVTPGYELDIPTLPDDSEPTVGVTFAFDAGEGQRPATFAAKSLPTGLKIDRTTGVISGVPTKPGSYTVQVTATHADRTKTTYTVAITVAPLPAEAQGTFTGWLTRGSGEVDGLFTLTAAKTGRLTGKLTVQTATVSLSAKAWTNTLDGVFTAVFSNRTGEQVELQLDSATGALGGSASGGKLGATALDIIALRNAALDTKDAAAQAALARYKGYYTVALPVESCIAPPPLENVQSGSGYLTLTVGAKASVKIAGKLADGTAVSGSTTLVITEDAAYVPLFKVLYTKRGVFSGLLKLEGGATPDTQRVADDPAYALTWLYPGKSATLTDDRFDARLDAYGAYYNTLADIQAVYTGMVFQVEGDFGWALTLLPGTSGSLTLAKKGPDNPEGVTLKAVKKTGLFSGSFKSEDNATGRTVTLKHAGVLTRDGEDYVGDGAYVESVKASPYTLKSSYRAWIAAPPPP